MSTRRGPGESVTSATAGSAPPPDLDGDSARPRARANERARPTRRRALHPGAHDDGVEVTRGQVDGAFRPRRGGRIARRGGGGRRVRRRVDACGHVGSGGRSGGSRSGARAAWDGALEARDGGAGLDFDPTDRPRRRLPESTFHWTRVEDLGRRLGSKTWVEDLGRRRQCRPALDLCWEVDEVGSEGGLCRTDKSACLRAHARSQPHRPHAVVAPTLRLRVRIGAPARAHFAGCVGAALDVGDRIDDRIGVGFCRSDRVGRRATDADGRYRRDGDGQVGRPL